jgi:cyclic dehypoxanthinyl futalosine synthase
MGISRIEALECFASDDLIGIGMEADAVRRRLHPEGVVTYTLDGKISYVEPSAQARTAPASDTLSRIYDGIEEVVAIGGTGITLHSDVTPESPLTWFETLLHRTKERFPAVWLHCLSASEILAIAEHSHLPLRDTIARLRDAGLDSIPGNDAGILDDAVQPQGIRVRWKTQDWLAVHRAAHGLGMQTTATMTFGGGETFEHRVSHLQSVRQLQEETGGFTSFTPWTLSTQGSPVPGFEEATAVEYLKTLAISRMYLDNIENVQSNLETQGLKVLQVGLRFGANDAGSVLHARGPNAATEEQVRQVIRDAGFRPFQRDTLYRTMLLT